MKRICFFNTYPTWGGGVKFYIEHAIGLKDKGYGVTAICQSNSTLSEAYSEADIPQLHLNVTGRSLLNPVKVARLIRFYKIEKIDIVIFTTSEDLKLGSITAKMAGVPTIVYRRGLAVPIKNRITNRYIFKNVLTHIMANSEETKRTILQHLGQHIDSNRIKVIYNALDTTDDPGAKPIPSILENSKGILIGNAGRLVHQKGQKHFIEIAKSLKAKGIVFTIFIAGAGPMEEELRNLIHEADLHDEIRLLGYVDNMKDFMASIDIFALTSIWEGFGYVLVEAMLASKPIVAFNTSSTPEIVLDEKTGYLVDYPDINLFADKLAILSADSSLRFQFGKTGSQSAKDRFEIKKQIVKFEEFISSRT